MRRKLAITFAVACLLSACTQEDGIVVYNAWIRPTVQGQNGAVYFVLNNHSAEADDLVGVSSSMAESVEIHESSMVEGTDVMQMNQVFSVPLNGGSEVTFKPGGLHIMLVDVKREIKNGETVEITLHFKKHADIPVNVSVSEFPPISDEHSH